MKKIIFYLILAVTVLLSFSCQREIEDVSLGLEDYYYLPRMKKLLLQPAYIGKSYSWTIKTATNSDSILSTNKDYIFLAAKEGTYHLTFHLEDGERGFTHSFPITVLHEEVEYSPYTAKVYEYYPAPGQFVNTMPLYEQGDDAKKMCQKAEEDLSNDAMISLGAYGGYVTFGFDHTVINISGQKDFYIKGNSFYSDIPEYKEKKGGSAEPGIVMVSFDRNMNGRPDDEWFELAGSEYYKPTTIKNYHITYRKPVDGKKAIPDYSGNITDKTYIFWTDNQDRTGFVEKNRFHTQNYYPEWIAADSLTFRGSLLPDNGVDISGFGSYYVLYAYDWGYVDNHPNSFKDLNSFDIDWAVDSLGHPVHLPGIDFIRVYTGVNQTCGWIGETSTEVARAQDLHIKTSPSVIPDSLFSTTNK